MLAPAAPIATVTQPPLSPDNAEAAPTAVAPAASAPSPVSRAPANPTAPPLEEIVVQGELHAPKEDPIRALNAQSFKAVQVLDDAIVGPLAMAYKHTLPEPARDGLHNALLNLTEPVVFLNDLLQLKPGRAAKTLGRFVINSTIGVGGLFDIAKKKPFHLAHHNNGFADTLGFYGVGPGPYLYLPLLGPTTLRDVFGRVIDLAVLPTAIGQPFSSRSFSLPNSALKSMDDRVTYDERQKHFRNDTPDPYAAERTAYLQRRADEIAGLHSPKPKRAAPSTDSKLPQQSSPPLSQGLPLTLQPQPPALAAMPPPPR